MSVPDELRRYVPRTDLYDSLELVHYHMPVEQPPATASYIIFKKGNKTYAKNGKYGHIEYEDIDSATVIQAAINTLPSEGGKIFIKPGIYKANIVINNKDNITLEGEGWGTIIIGASSNAITLQIGGTGDSVTARGIKILNLHLQGGVQDGLTSVVPLQVGTSENVHIEKVKISDYDLKAVRLGAIYSETQARSKNIAMKDCFIDEMVGSLTENAVCMTLGGIDHGLIENVYFYKGPVTAGTGIATIDFSYGEFNNTLLYDVHIRKCIFDSIRVDPVIAGFQRVRVCSIKDCMFIDGCGQILFKESVGTGVTRLCEDFSFSGNKFRAISSHGLTIPSARVDDVLRCKIEGNIFDTSTDTTSTWVAMQLAGKEFSVKNNVVKNWAGIAIYILDLRDSEVVNNVLLNSSQRGGSNLRAELRIDGGDNVLISGNLMKGNLCPSISYSGGTNLKIWENLLEASYSGNYIYQINPFDSTVSIKRNTNYVTENEGIATFSGDGSTTTFNIPHGLADTPSKYGVSPLTPDADASRTITADVTNITITFDTAPPSGTDNLKFGWWARV